jgi:hypothetical protein
MSLSDLVNHATNKERFHTVEQYIDFCARYLEYIDTELRAHRVAERKPLSIFPVSKRGQFQHHATAEFPPYVRRRRLCQSGATVQHDT